MREISKKEKRRELKIARSPDIKRKGLSVDFLTRERSKPFNEPWFGKRRCNTRIRRRNNQETKGEEDRTGSCRSKFHNGHGGSI